MPLRGLIVKDSQGWEHTTHLPLELITGTGSDPRPRLRVDASQTSFFEGREFRVYHEFNIASGASVWLRFTVPLNCSIHNRDIMVVQGNLRFALGTGTSSGVWTPKQVLPVNARTDRALYIGEITCDFGGTGTGVTERDVMLLETGTTQAVTAHASVPEQGMAPGVYFVELRNTGSGTLRGLYRVHWEEAQPRSSLIY